MDPVVEGTVGGEMLDRMLTKREQFALGALQGLLAANSYSYLTAPLFAVRSADSLIEALR